MRKAPAALDNDGDDINSNASSTILSCLDSIEKELKAVRQQLEEMPVQVTEMVLASGDLQQHVSSSSQQAVGTAASGTAATSKELPLRRGGSGHRLSSSTVSAGFLPGGLEGGGIQPLVNRSSRRVSLRHASITFSTPFQKPLIGGLQEADKARETPFWFDRHDGDDTDKDTIGRPASPGLHTAASARTLRSTPSQRQVSPHSPTEATHEGTMIATQTGSMPRSMQSAVYSSFTDAQSYRQVSVDPQVAEAITTSRQLNTRKIRSQLLTTSLSQQEAMRAAMLSMGQSIVDIEFAEDPPQCMLRPGDPWRLLWDLIMCLATVIVGLLCPVGLAYFDVEDFFVGPVAIILYVLDAFWLLDIVVNLRTGYSRAGHIELKAKKVAVRYMKRWFVLDVIAAWPLLLAGDSSAMLATVFVLKICRVAKLGPMISRLEKETGWGWLLSVKVALLLCLWAHSMACLWRLVLQMDNTPEPEVDSWWDIYTEDAYWMVMTMTTVGYGDVSASGTSSRIFSMAVMLLASLFFAAIVSTLTHATRWLFDDKTEKCVRDARNFMSRHGIPQELQRRAEQNLRQHLLQERQKVLDPRVFTLLSPNIQRELSLALLGETVLRFPLFKGALHSFVAEVAQAHYWLLCTVGDLVAEEGQIISEVVFLVEGELIARLSPWSEDNAFDMDVGSAPAFVPEFADGPPREVHLPRGAWFGEACLLDRQRVRTATFVAATDAELAVLPASEYKRVLQKYPRLLHRHRNIETAVHDGQLDLVDLAYQGNGLTHRAASRDTPSGGSTASPSGPTRTQSEAKLAKFLQPCHTADFSDPVDPAPPAQAVQRPRTSQRSAASEASLMENQQLYTTPRGSRVDAV